MTIETWREWLNKKAKPFEVPQIGFQPRTVESLAADFPLRVFDLDPDNIGTQKFQVTVEGCSDLFFRNQG